jgi:DNA repair exonuclease SbcCD ATPase subunit
MNILAVSYSNIGPFENQIVTLILKSGTYLIKAPIGSGKSFLFFDGLVFALYGYSKRDMLNVNSKTGRTKILFENDDKQMFFIERPLSGKKWVKLYQLKDNENPDRLVAQQIHAFLDDKYTQIVNRGIDFSEDLDFSLFEETQFHRALETQQSIELLLPPKNVFLNRHLLMQDSENLFELQPKARIDVLKLMFGLDMIDSVRDQIGEIKNNLKGQYKIVSESNHITEQYDRWYTDLSQTINSVFNTLETLSTTSLQTSDFAQLETIREFVQNPLSRSSDSLHYDIGQRSLDKRIKNLESLRLKKLNYEQQQISILSDLQSLQKDLDLSLSEQSQLQKLFEWNDLKEGQEVEVVTKETLNSLIQSKESLLKDIEALNSLISHEIWLTLEKEYQLSSPDHSLLRFAGLLEQLMQIGKVIKAELDTALAQKSSFESKIQNKSQQLEHTKQQLESHKQQLRDQAQQNLQHQVSTAHQTVTSTQRQKESLELQIQSLDESLKQLEVQAHSTVHNECTLDHVHCPSVEEIIKIWSENLRIQIENQTIQKQNLIKNLETITAQLLTEEKQLMEAQSAQGLSTKEKFVYLGTEFDRLSHLVAQLEVQWLTDQEKMESGVIEGKINSISDKLNRVREDYKRFSSLVAPEQIEKFRNSQAQLDTLTNQIISTQSLIQKSQEQHLLRVQNQSKLEQINKQIQTLQDQLEHKKLLSVELESHLQDPLFTLLDSLEINTKKLENLLSKAQDLLAEKTRIQDQSVKIKADVDRATLLHTIFGKELTLYVLKSYIPLLNEYINAFLAKVVSFQLNISVNEEGDELELTIEDEFGSREVKSLSGGQKTILRLCWILATSVVFRNSFLLLDETINNLDEAIISNVAELLTDYVKQYNLSFYTVTHSAQIQNMSIWDETIEINITH